MSRRTGSPIPRNSGHVEDRGERQDPEEGADQDQGAEARPPLALGFRDRPAQQRDLDDQRGGQDEQHRRGPEHGDQVGLAGIGEYRQKLLRHGQQDAPRGPGDQRGPEELEFQTLPLPVPKGPVEHVDEQGPDHHDRPDRQGMADDVRDPEYAQVPPELLDDPVPNTAQAQGWLRHLVGQLGVRPLLDSVTDPPDDRPQSERQAQGRQEGGVHHPVIDVLPLVLPRPGQRAAAELHKGPAVVGEHEEEQQDAGPERGERDPLRHREGRAPCEPFRGQGAVEVEEEPGGEHDHHPEREEHHQVYGDVAKPDHDDRPRVRRQQPELGGHVAAIRPEVVNRLGLLVHDRPSDGFRCRGIIVAGRGVEEIAIGLALPDPAGRELSLDVAHVAVSLEPRGEPAPGVAAAGDGREVVEPTQQAQRREPLEQPDRERPAPDPAAGERDPRQVLVQREKSRLGQSGIRVRVRLELKYVAAVLDVFFLRIQLFTEDFLPPPPDQVQLVHEDLGKPARIGGLLVRHIRPSPAGVEAGKVVPWCKFRRGQGRVDVIREDASPCHAIVARNHHGPGSARASC